MKAAGSFVKGEALGNDYIVLDTVALPFPLTAARVRALCDRHEGIGADGIIEVRETELVDGAPARAAVVVWNADGSTAEVSGNGLRIAALALERAAGAVIGVATAAPAAWSLQLTSAGHDFGVDGAAGVDEGAHGAATIRIHLPPARIATLAEPFERPGQGPAIVLTRIDIGNPHAVFEDRGLADDEWERIARTIEMDPRFPARTNVECFERIDDRSIAIRVHERGVGPTRASGTGAAAAAAAAVARGRLPPGRIQVRMAGGEVVIEIRPDSLVIAGPVRLVFRGVLDPHQLESLARR